MQRDFEVRFASQKDVNSLHELLIQLSENVLVKHGLDNSVIMKNLKNALENDENSIMVAVKNKQIVGMLYATTHQSLLHTNRSVLIEELVIHQDFRRKGLGSTLMRKYFKYAEDKGFCEIEVSTEITNKKAIHYYKKWGFEEVGILMEKEIGEQ